MRFWLVLPAVFVLGLLAGCDDAPSSATSPGAAAPQAGEPWRDEVKPLPGAEKVGASGSACELPVSFSLPAAWRPKPVQTDGGPFDELAKSGGATMRCEIDAKPAGHIGFLRVWTSDRAEAEPRQVLESFLADGKETFDPRYRETNAGELPAVEVTFLKDSPLAFGLKRERALAVDTRDGVALLTLSGTDTEEYEGMLPAYMLAKQTLTVSM
jgi:hypothetical protein